MNSLIISDLHLTEKPDEDYRWNVFQSARNYLKKEKIPLLFILGDLFHNKDRHPAELTNRLIDELVQCAEIADVNILLGNHDYLKIDSPFLGFLQHIPNIKWVDKPQFINFKEYKTLWLPHSRTPEIEWEPFFNKDVEEIDIIFMHQSVIGCKVSNMFEMNHGLNLSWLTSRSKAKIYSGDIHVPQDIGVLTYIGTPHPVAFGDTYQPRMLHIKNDIWKPNTIPLTTIKRVTLTANNFLDFKSKIIEQKIIEGDHVKVKVLLKTTELSNWSEIKNNIKEYCTFKNIKLFDVTLEKESTEIIEENDLVNRFTKVNPQEALEHYIKVQEDLDPYIANIGKNLLNACLNKTV